MDTTTKIKSFVKGFAAILKGDDAEASAQKAFRQADSAFKRQISSLEGDTINFEDKVTDAKDALKLARVNNGQPITDRDAYIETILAKKNAVTKAEEDHKKHLAKIEFLKEEAALLAEDVDA